MLSEGGASLRSTHPTQVVLSAHVGDLDSVLSVDVFRRAIDDLVVFFQARPDAIVCDLHPDYASTLHAERLAARWDVPLLRVQHHHAHVAACMAEHGLAGPVLGFSWDGTGYGPDGTVWGGEVLWCDGAEFRRAAHLRTFALPGGDRAVREPRRSALGLLFEIFGERAAEHAAAWFSAGELKTLLSMLAGRVHSPRTSSMGRLFDAVAALCGLPPVISFEGQAAMALEFAADESEEGIYPIRLRQGRCGNLPAQRHRSPTGSRWSVRSWPIAPPACLCQRSAPGSTMPWPTWPWQLPAKSPYCRSKSCRSCSRGGCFQNALLTARLCSRLAAAGFQVYTHHKVPPGDGGIALGQVWLALRQLRGSLPG